jgi:hypothetical protein
VELLKGRTLLRALFSEKDKHNPSSFVPDYHAAGSRYEDVVYYPEGVMKFMTDDGNEYWLHLNE